MFKLLYRTLLLAIICLPLISAPAQNAGSAGKLWHSVEDLAPGRPLANPWMVPAAFKAFRIDPSGLAELLAHAPSEKNSAASPSIISLPMPDGSLAQFRFVESPIMAPELAAKFPQIKTYRGRGIDDPLATVRFDLTPTGFHAQILSPHGAVYIDPYYRGDSLIHASSFKRDYRRAADGFICLTESTAAAAFSADNPLALSLSGEQLRTYRLACAATGEYTQFHGGTVNSAMAAIVTAINRVSGVYETELAIRLELIGNNELLVYTNPNMDPYNNSSGSTMLGQNQANLDDVIGSGNYDIGHVFSTGGGGIAGLGVVCVTGRKAYGVTGLPAPTGDAFYIDYVAHEMGHQFGANHTFNSTTGSCGGGNRNPATAYEPGSGSTIMAYAGICGADDLQPHSDPYFHSISLEEIVAFTSASAGSTCAVLAPTSNTPPTVAAGPNYIIPKGTPFILTANGTDANGDLLTYCWEQRDLGAATTLSAADNGFSPLFRSFNPTLSAARTFPRLTDLLNNSFALGEKLPNTSRTLNFRVVARDNQDGGGGIHSASMQVTVVTNSGPFFITSPNSAVTWSNIQNVTWNVAGTTASPVNAAEVDLLLSTDGGLTFPFILATNVPNDGAHPVLLPNLVTDTARIKVRAANNIFFDISDANFSIIESIPAPTIIVEGTSLVSETCVNGALDPNETVTINFLLRNIGSAATTNLIVSLLSTNGLSVQTAPQTLGVLQPNDPAVSIPITFAAAGSCGGQLQAQFRLQDGSAELGTLIQPLALGNAVVSTTIWSNSIPMSIPAPGDTRGPALPFPSSMLVSGITGTVVKVEVTLQGLTHGASDDIDILLTGPAGQNILLMSDAGNGGPVNNLTLTFNDFAPTGLSGSSALTSGTFKPTNFDNNSDSFPDPAPTGPYGVVLASFKSVNPNGAWSLYVQDDFKQNGGSLQGWNLKITTSNVTCCGSSPPQSDLAVGGAAQPTSVNVGSPLVFSLRVTNLGPATAGSVTVTDALPASVALILASSSQGTYSVDGSLVSFDLGPLTNGAIANVSIAVEPTLSGSITNRAWVSTANVDPDLVNNYVAQIANINSTNHPPVLLPIADRIIHAGSALQITNSATDPDIPTNTLTFSLGADPPAGAEITPTGVFHWQTSDADLNTTNQVTIRVTDDGLPALFDQDSFLVTVIQRPMIASIVLSNASVVLTWNAIAGQRYQVEYQETLTSSNGVTLPPIITASGAQASFEDPLTSQRRYYRVVVLP